MLIRILGKDRTLPGVPPEGFFLGEALASWGGEGKGGREDGVEERGRRGRRWSWGALACNAIRLHPEIFLFHAVLPPTLDAVFTQFCRFHLFHLQVLSNPLLGSPSMALAGTHHPSPGQQQSTS